MAVDTGSDIPAAGSGSPGPPTPVRLAALLIGVEGLCTLGLTGYLVLDAPTASTGVGAVLGQAGLFVLFAAAMLVVALGLLRGRFWARTPGIVIQALLLPAVFSLIGPSHQALAGLVGGVVVLTALVSLLGERSRRWSEALDEARRQG